MKATRFPLLILIALCAMTLAATTTLTAQTQTFRGALNGLRPAVVALISAAGISFLFLALWNTETPPADWSRIDLRGALILALSLAAARQKISVVKLLLGSGLLGVTLGLFF